ncbi:MAG: HD domain-containing protein, partial [Rhodobacteraceae bacterium]|nr:HD domain-containing protein [Paracoccaceae bacterium]
MRTEKNKITNGHNTIEYDWDKVLEDLLAKISSFEAHPDTEKVREAYYFSLECHKDQNRKSGEPYFTHLVAVANILADKQLHSDIIISALLHDSIEDTEGVVYKSIQEKFGHEIAGIVDGVTKITELNLDPTVQKQAANVQKLIVAVAKDDRVILVKLADRLHNLQTIEHLSPAKRRFKAKEP